MTAGKIATLRTAKAKSFAIAEELQNRPNPSNKKGQNDRPLHVFAANQTYSNKQYFGGLQHGRGKLKTCTAQGRADQIAIHADLIAIHWDQITIHEDQITIQQDQITIRWDQITIQWDQITIHDDRQKQTFLQNANND